jgi:hypothetical protein
LKDDNINYIQSSQVGDILDVGHLGELVVGQFAANERHIVIDREPDVTIQRQSNYQHHFVIKGSKHCWIAAQTTECIVGHIRDEVVGKRSAHTSSTWHKYSSEI